MQRHKRLFGFELLEDRLPLASDWGDAPDDGSGQYSQGNYRTRASSGGPSHVLVAGLFMGASVDGELDAFPSRAATTDDQFVVFGDPGRDDEDGLVNPIADLTVTTGAQPKVGLYVTNLTGSPAALFGWIDYDRNGRFGDVNSELERAKMTVPSGTDHQLVTLNFPPVPEGFLGETYARFRLTTDPSINSDAGAAYDGEVEDYAATIFSTSAGVATGISKIGDRFNGGPDIEDSEEFGASVTSIGDLDGDGIGDYVVGSPGFLRYAFDSGAIYTLLMNSDNTVRETVRFVEFYPGAPASTNGRFGHAVANIGDVNGDGIQDIAVGAPEDDADGGDFSLSGAVFILCLNRDGTVKQQAKLVNSTTENGGQGAFDRFGSSVTAIGDINGDGTIDLAVGAIGDDSGGDDRGAVYIVNLYPIEFNDNPPFPQYPHYRIVVTAPIFPQRQKISQLDGNFGGVLQNGSHFGQSVASLGDIDGDGVTDLAVGELGNGANAQGAVWILFLNSDGTVKRSQKIDSSNGNFPEPLSAFDHFGGAVSSAGDLDGNGVPDLIVGADGDDNGGGGVDRGAAWILFLNTNGQVNYARKLSSTDGGFNIPLSNFDRFATSITSAGDRNGDGVPDLLVGAPLDDTGGSNRGAVYTVFLNSGGVLPAVHLVSFLRQTPSQNPTSVDTLVFRAVFSDPVQNVDVNDFQVHGQSTATVTDVTKFSDNIYYITVSGGDLSIFNGVVGVDLAATLDIADLNGTRIPVAEPNVDETYTLIHLDYGDAPDRSPGTGPAQQAGNVFLPINYNTLSSDNGPSHATTRKLYMGSFVDTETEAVQEPTGLGDDLNQGLDDEDGLSFSAEDLTLLVGDRPRVRIHVTNITGSEASLYGWIDFNGDGVFNNATERGSIVVPDGTVDGTVTLEFPQVPFTGIRSTFARFRISTDAATANPTGLAADGEVEDYPVSIKVDTLVSRDASGSIVVRDIATESNDTLTIQSDTANQRYIITDPVLVVAASVVGAVQVDAHQVLIPFSLVTGPSIVFDTLGGEDTLSVDFALGNFFKALDFQGGVQTTADHLVLQNGVDFDNVTHFLKSKGSGSISVKGNELISYSAVETIADNLEAKVRGFLFQGGNEIVTINDDDAVENNDSRIDSTHGTLVNFRSPKDLLLVSTGPFGGTGDDQIIVSGLDLLFNCNLNILGDDTDVITFKSSLTSTGTGSLYATAETIGVLAPISTTSAGSVTLSASRRVFIANGGSITSEDGNITVDGNAGGQTLTGASIGVSIGAARVSSKNGSIRFTGRGGKGGGGIYGVLVHSKAVIETTGDSALASITITGIGAGEFRAEAVLLYDCTIASKSGAIVIKGTGGDNAQSSNVGVRTESASITTRGEKGGIEIDGIAGTGQQSNFGVLLAASQLTAVSGAIKITGTAKSTGDVGSNENDGVRIVAGTTITSTGMGPNAATISIVGFGGAGDDNNDGVIIADAGTLISSIEGAITVRGTGASNGGNDSDSSAGVSVEAGATIISTGIAATSAPIKLIGVGGRGDDGNVGVAVTGPGTKVSSMQGAITIVGTGGSNGIAESTLNFGAWIGLDATIASTGVGSLAATISVIGLAGSGNNDNYGIAVNSQGNVTSIDGDIFLVGTGGSNGRALSNGNNGVAVYGGARITSTGTGNDAGQIIIAGNGGSGDDFNIGIGIYDATSLVSSVDGDISLNGVGGSNGQVGSTNNHGVLLISGATVSSVGTGRDAARISVVGTGANGDATNEGVVLDGVRTTLTSVDGAVSIFGVGGPKFSEGILVQLGATITSTGVGANAATLTLHGRTGAQSGVGVKIVNQGTSITSTDGGIAINGAMASDDTVTSSQNYGVTITAGASVSSLGIRGRAAKLSIDGAGGNGDNNNIGVLVDGSTTRISTVDGDLLIRGNGGSNGMLASSFNYGIWIGQASVLSLGTGIDAARIELIGTGGNGSDGNMGVFQALSARISSIGGDISVIGSGGSNRTVGSKQNFGVYLIESPQISSTGVGSNAAKIHIRGFGGGGEFDNDGVRMSSNSQLNSRDGAITVDGTGGSNESATSNDNDGVVLELGAKISSTGTGPTAASISIKGVGGVGLHNNSGVAFLPNVTLSSIDGDIQIDGTGASRADSYDCWGVIGVGLSVESTGTGPDAAGITILGTSGEGSNHNTGVALFGSQLTAISGSILATGTGRSTDGANSGSNYGVQLDGGTNISSTGSGAYAAPIAIAGTGGKGQHDNDGVILSGRSTISSIDGDIRVIGTGRSSGRTDSHFNIGVRIITGSKVSSLGVGPDAASVSIEGSGGAGATFNMGVLLQDLNTQITTVDGDIQITGQAASQDEVAFAFASGVAMILEASVTSTGVGPEAGTITIAGNGGRVGSQNSGVELSLLAKLTSRDGNINITGTGGANSSNNTHASGGVVVTSGAVVASIGTGVNAAAININGNGGLGGSVNTGLIIAFPDTKISSVDGAIHLSGVGGGVSATGMRNYGVALSGQAIVQATGAGVVEITGQAGEGTNQYAIEVSDNSSVMAFAGQIVLTATDTASAHDDILVANTATLQSRVLDVTLRAGDDLTLEAGSTVSAANGRIICIGDYGDADPSVGSTLNLLGTLVNGQVGNISGGNDQDRIVVDPATGNSINRLLLDGRGGDDTYVIQFGRFGGVGKPSGITISDSGASDSDRAQVMGTTASESFKVQNLAPNGTNPQSGGFVENVTVGEKVTYSNSLEFLEVYGDPQPNQPGLSNNDTFGVQPSQTAAIHVHGGNPKLGDPNTPSGNPVGTGDVLNFDSLGNPYLNANRQISTSGGSPSPFKVVTYEEIETALTGPTVESVVVNDGQKQRSRVNSLTIAFSQVVTLDSNAISMVRVSDNQSIQLSISLSIIGGKTVATLKFSGAGTEFGSLADGNYRVTVQQGRVRAPDGAVLAANYVDNVFRLFGDADGDRDTDNLDFLGFMKILGAKVGDVNYRWFLDINGDGKIDNSDRAAISSRVGRRI